MADNKVTTHEALEDMGYASTGDITPTENFYLSKEGITFYYNVYDITPYAMGPVKVTVPSHLPGYCRTVTHLCFCSSCHDKKRKSRLPKV